jgi:uncharacterized cupredoxin-like copper-binding protein
MAILRALKLGFVLLLSLVLGFAWGGFQLAAFAAVAPSQQPVNEVTIHLGTVAGELKFEPANLEFESGKRYQLTLDNPGQQKHYFTAKDFADSIWTQKVEAGNVEIKGAIHELELKPGAIAQWVFIPLKAGAYRLHCSIPGHSEAGMQGMLTVN